MKSGTQGRNLEAGTDVETGGKALIVLLSMAYSAGFSYRPQDLMPRGWHRPQWAGPPKSIINLKSDPQACLMEIFSQLWLLLLR